MLIKDLEHYCALKIEVPRSELDENKGCNAYSAYFYICLYYFTKYNIYYREKQGLQQS